MSKRQFTADDFRSIPCRVCGAEYSCYSPQCPHCGDLNPIPGVREYARRGQKSKTTQALLALFLGPLGIHNFYTGRIGQGGAQLAITLLTGGLGSFLTYPWALLNIANQWTDAAGLPFSCHPFDPAEVAANGGYRPKWRDVAPMLVIGLVIYGVILAPVWLTVIGHSAIQEKMAEQAAQTQQSTDHQKKPKKAKKPKKRAE